MVGSIIIVGTLTLFIVSLRVSFENHMQHNLIWELILYEFEQNHNAAEATKNICVKGESAVDHSTITIGLKKFCLGWKYLDHQERSVRPKTVDSETILQERSKSMEKYSENIRWAQYLTVHCVSSPSWPQQKDPVQLKCVLCYQNIAKLLT